MKYYYFNLFFQPLKNVKNLTYRPLKKQAALQTGSHAVHTDLFS